MKPSISKVLLAILPFFFMLGCKTKSELRRERESRN